MLSLPEFALMIEHNNELLSNEQKRNENMKETLEKSKKFCKYTEQKIIDNSFTPSIINKDFRNFNITILLQYYKD